MVDADPYSPAEEVAAALGQIAPGQLWLHGQRFGGQARLAESGLRDGSVLVVGEKTGTPPLALEPGSTSSTGGNWELAVVSGPHSGRSIALSTDREVIIGRDSSATLTLDDATVSRSHARLFPSRTDALTGWMVEDIGSSNGTWLGGARVSAIDAVPADQPIEIGSSVLEVRRGITPDADVRPDAEGELVYNRPPRIQPSTGDPLGCLGRLTGRNPALPWVAARE